MKEEKTKQTSMIYGVIAVVIALGAGFFGGMKYQQMSGNTRGNRQFQAGVAGGFGGGRGASGTGGVGNRGGFRPVSGEVIASDEKSITVKLQDGSSKIVIMNDKTQVNKADVATKSDIAVGSKVAVFGMDNSDGSVTAQSVQLNPMMRGIGETTPTPKN